ncbi:hypothetical protein H6F67_15270 [Microcoleus sp. FACHB-1515]|uniref:lipid-A-disaccharide synthase-related protein n=1 Tax=Cyanophyceae TaxID=3028117 RepID=UPI0016838AAA|nr:lipid-A-disaccharide synthase-related protein [Microcoleus sp. FACHB-1515]MBD2091214.1 hypothetical protein [Microcoleus sp. FACHB-1515]
MQLLCLSNGHGEDAIALRILQALQQRSPNAKIAALPIVGEGHAFTDHGIAIVGTVKPMPSGGFIYQDGRQFARDLRGGLLKLTLAQRKTVRAWAKAGGVILAVGDIVPLLFAWMSGAPYAFVGTAKSEYYLRDEVGLLPRPTWFERMESWSGSVYLPWERWLMQRSHCRAVFPRDSLTAQVLQRWPIPVFDLGNPMMDGLEAPATEPVDRDGLTFVLLPGSRPPEAYQNWQRILVAVQALIDARLGRSLLFLGAIAPQLDLQPLSASLIAQGWTQNEDCFTQGKATIALSQTHYRDCLHEADFAIAMAGTATEQFVGLGKPALTIAGEGPQFTPKFAEAQTRLLGASAILLQDPRQAPKIVRSLLQDPDRLHLIAENGRRRLGATGAADRIAECLLDRFA